jgi:hypothetical protein
MSDEQPAFKPAKLRGTGFAQKATPPKMTIQTRATTPRVFSTLIRSRDTVLPGLARGGEQRWGASSEGGHS